MGTTGSLGDKRQGILLAKCPDSGLQETTGALAQLGERLICIQEVRSSILLGSTKSLMIRSVSVGINVYSSNRTVRTRILFENTLPRTPDTLNESTGN